MPGKSNESDLCLIAGVWRDRERPAINGSPLPERDHAFLASIHERARSPSFKGLTPKQRRWLEVIRYKIDGDYSGGGRPPPRRSMLGGQRCGWVSVTDLARGR